MVVCKFWLDNRCRFGANCRFEHPSKDGSQGGLFSTNNSWQGGGGGGQRVSFQNSFGGSSAGGAGGNQYKWVANQAQGGQEGSARSPLDVVNGLPDEIDTWEKSKMWPFSCVALEKDLPSLPDFQDFSMEEMRFEAYQAKAQGSMQPYIQKSQALTSEFQNKKRQLKQMTMDLKQKLISFIDEGRKKKTAQSAPTTSGFGMASQPQAGLFGSSGSSSSATGSLFGKTQSSTPSTFGGGSSASPTPGLFGSGFGGGAAATTPQGSLFGGGSGAAGQASLFGGSSGGAAGGTLFGKPAGGALGSNNNNSSSSVFGGGSQTSSATGASLLGPGPSPPSGLFGAGAGLASSPAPGLFGSGSNPPAPNLFGSASSGAGLFGKSPVTPGAAAASQSSLLGPVPTSLPATPQQASLFGKAAEGAQPPPFGGAAPQQQNSSAPNLFGGNSQNQTAQQGAPNLFGKPAAVGQPSGLFGGGGSGGAGLFGKVPPTQGGNSAVPQAGEVESPTLFTPLSELTEAEKAAFEAKAFVLGKIPLRPPPKELVSG